MRFTHPTASHRPGLSLLEVILALSILAVAMGVIGSLFSLGMRHAAAARDLSPAQLYAESIMSEIVAGSIPTEGSTSGGPVPTEIDPSGEWSYSVESKPREEAADLLQVTVTVMQERGASYPVEFSLVRWVLDPAATQAAEDAAAEQAAANNATSNASNSGTTSGTTSGGSTQPR